jgi:hypothetical protein
MSLPCIRKWGPTFNFLKNLIISADSLHSNDNKFSSTIPYDVKLEVVYVMI